MQDGSVDYVKQLFIVRKPSVDARVFEDKLNEAVAELQKSYPYMSTREISTGRYQIVVPVELDVYKRQDWIAGRSLGARGPRDAHTTQPQLRYVVGLNPRGLLHRNKGTSAE